MQIEFRRQIYAEIDYGPETAFRGGSSGCRAVLIMNDCDIVLQPVRLAGSGPLDQPKDSICQRLRAIALQKAMTRFAGGPDYEIKSWAFRKPLVQALRYQAIP